MIIIHIIIYTLLVAFIYHLIKRDGKYIKHISSLDANIQELKKNLDNLKFSRDKLLKSYNITLSKLRKLQSNKNKGTIK